MKRLLVLVHRLEDSILVLLLLAMILLAGYDILARTLFGGGVSWIPPLLRVMVLWIGLLGALLATRSREHISIDLINRLGGPVLKKVSSVMTLIFASVVSGIVAWHSGKYVQMALEFGDMAFDDVPAWPLQRIIPISFGLMALRFGIQSIQTLIGKEVSA
jgi:TRAP-type C4-dicarboxylate transport system permease small subunit